jgi:hypothetical protein
VTKLRQVNHFLLLSVQILKNSKAELFLPLSDFLFIINHMNILGKIELPPREINPERYHEFLLSEMENISKEVNGEFGNFLNKNAVIEMDGFSEEEIGNDKKNIRQKEEVWASEQYKDLETWKRDKSRHTSNIAEMAVTLAFHRSLKDRFIVARASEYDDYEHGCDNVIIDKETGAIVCGFDEVVDYAYREEAENKKVKKIRNNLEKGGTEIKYGATVTNGELQRKSFKNIPTFYLSISRKDLDKLLLSLQKNEGNSEISSNILNQLVDSLENQYSDFSNLNLNSKLRDNLTKFSESLSLIKELIKTK